MKRMLGVVCALIAVRAGADTIADLKVAVGRMSAKQPIRATYMTEALTKATGKFANETTSRTASAEVAHDPSGVTITIPQGLIDKALRETQANGPDDNGPAQGAIGSIRALSVVEALDYRDTLLSTLRYATVTEERRVLLRGQPARLLVLKLNEPERKKKNSIQIGHAKREEDRMNVWVGDDNLPLAAERVQKTSAGFMMFSGEQTSRTHYTFAHAGDRLILARVTVVAAGSGLGQKIDQTAVQTLTPH